MQNGSSIDEAEIDFRTILSRGNNVVLEKIDNNKLGSKTKIGTKKFGTLSQKIEVGSRIKFYNQNRFNAVANHNEHAVTKKVVNTREENGITIIDTETSVYKIYYNHDTAKIC